MDSCASGPKPPKGPKKPEEPKTMKEAAALVGPVAAKKAPLKSPMRSTPKRPSGGR